MTYKQQYEAVQKHMEYLVAEGIAVKIGNEYRLKTKKEIKQELEEILKDE